MPKNGREKTKLDYILQYNSSPDRETRDSSTHKEKIRSKKRMRKSMKMKVT